MTGIWYLIERPPEKEDLVLLGPSPRVRMTQSSLPHGLRQALGKGAAYKCDKGAP